MKTKGTTKQKGMPLSPTQKKVWGYILGYFTDNNYMPTRSEIAIFLGYPDKGGVQMANDVLLRMEEKGFIKLEHYKHRGIKIIERKAAVTYLIKPRTYPTHISSL